MTVIRPVSGGVIYSLGQIKNAIIDTLFTNNSARLTGGAISASEIGGGIINSRFIKNEAKGGADDTNNLAGLGGALFLDGKGNTNTIITDGSFFGNAASADKEHGGLGGAIFHNAAIDSGDNSSLTIGSSELKASIFYGNRHRNKQDGKQANAIYFGNIGNVEKPNTGDYGDRTTNFTINTVGGITIMMFDPLRSQEDGKKDANGKTYGKLPVDINKTGGGHWYLGGVSQMNGASHWRIKEGTFDLIEVDEVKDEINLNHDKTSSFTLDEVASLTGSGTIKAREIALSGIIDPSTSAKFGHGPERIDNNSRPNDFRVYSTSAYGTIRLDTSASGEAAVLDHVIYKVDLGVDENGATINDMISASNGLSLNGVDIEIDNIRGLAKTESPAQGASRYNDRQHTIFRSDTGEIYGKLGEIRDNFPFWWQSFIYEDGEIALNLSYDEKRGKAACESNNSKSSNRCSSAGGIVGGAKPDPAPEPVPGNPGEKPDTGNPDNGAGGGNGGGSNPPATKPDEKPDLNPDTKPTLPPVSNSDAVMDAIVNLNGDELSRAYDNLSGEIYASSHTAVLGNSKIGEITSQNLLEGAYFDAAISPWASTYGFSGQTNGNDNTAAIHNSGHGVAFGFDMSPSENLLAGVILGSGRIKIGNGQSRNSHIEVESYDIGDYLGAHIGALRLNGGVIYSHLNFDSERDIWIKGKEKAHYHGSKIQAFGEASLPLTGQLLRLISTCHKLGSKWIVRWKTARRPRLKLWVDVTSSSPPL